MFANISVIQEEFIEIKYPQPIFDVNNLDYN